VPLPHSGPFGAVAYNQGEGNTTESEVMDSGISDTYSVKELTRLLHLTPRQILLRVHKHGIAAERCGVGRGGAYRIPLSELVMRSMWGALPPERSNQDVS